MGTERLGIIDLGSNSSRLVVYEIYPDRSYQRVFEMKQNLQLARDMGPEKLITDSALARAIACSKLFSRAGKLHNVAHWIPVATAAIRQASNRQAILSLMEEETGFRFRVLEEWEEGYYGYLGVVNTLPIQDALLFDIGGASTELMLVRDRNLVEVKSLPFGALNLTEYLSSVTETLRGDKAYEFMVEQYQTIPWLNQARGLPLVGLGGTARAVAKLHRAESPLRAERIHGYPVGTSFALEAFTALKDTNAEKRRKIKGLSKARAQILVAGLAAIAALIDRNESTDLLVSRSGLREGLFYEHLLRPDQVDHVDSVLDHSIRNLQRLYHVNLPITTMVRDVALQLFDTLAPVHQLGSHERQLLRVTAEIEGVGYYINTEKSDRHSAYLTLNSHLYGLTYSQFQDVANLLEGKGSSPIRKLLLLIRLAKLITLQLGIDPNRLYCKLQRDHLEVGRAPGIEETVSASADADFGHDFLKGFGIHLRYVE